MFWRKSGGSPTRSPRRSIEPGPPEAGPEAGRRLVASIPEAVEWDWTVGVLVEEAIGRGFLVDLLAWTGYARACVSDRGARDRREGSVMAKHEGENPADAIAVALAIAVDAREREAGRSRA